MYFYKSGDAWVIGDTPLSFAPVGSYCIQGSAEAASINIVPVNPNSNLERYHNVAITDIIKNAGGDKYGDTAEFVAVAAVYFAALAAKGDTGAAGAPGANGDDGLFAAPLANCADYDALKTAMIAAGLMAGA